MERFSGQPRKTWRHNAIAVTVLELQETKRTVAHFSGASEVGYVDVACSRWSRLDGSFDSRMLLGNTGGNSRNSVLIPRL